MSGGLPWEPLSHGACAGLGATPLHHRGELGTGGGRETAAAPMRGGGKGGKPGWAPVVPRKELFYVCYACVGGGARVLSWQFTGAGTGGSARLFLAELGKGIKQGLCFLRQGVRKGSLSHPCSGKNGNSVSQGCASVPFPFTCLGREASITCYSASPQSLGRGRESTR